MGWSELGMALGVWVGTSLALPLLIALVHWIWSPAAVPPRADHPVADRAWVPVEAARRNALSPRRHRLAVLSVRSLPRRRPARAGMPQR